MELGTMLVKYHRMVVDKNHQSFANQLQKLRHIGHFELGGADLAGGISSGPVHTVQQRRTAKAYRQVANRNLCHKSPDPNVAVSSASHS